MLKYALPVALIGAIVVGFQNCTGNTFQSAQSYSLESFSDADIAKMPDTLQYSARNAETSGDLQEFAIQPNAANLSEDLFRMTLPDGRTIVARQTEKKDIGGGLVKLSSNIIYPERGMIDMLIRDGRKVTANINVGEKNFVIHQNDSLGKQTIYDSRAELLNGSDEHESSIGLSAIYEETLPISTAVDTVDILIVYSALAPVNPDTIRLAYVKAKETFARSRIEIRLRLVGIRPISFDPRPYTGGGGLIQAFETNAEVRALRDQYGADFVHLVVPGWSLAGNVNGMASSAVSSGQGYGFSLTGMLNETLTHEIGHIFGAQHNREDGLLTADYAFGWGNSFARDIMSYARPGFGPREFIFSSPELTFSNGSPAGTATADNRRVIRQMKLSVSRARPQYVLDSELDPIDGGSGNPDWTRATPPKDCTLGTKYVAHGTSTTAYKYTAAPSGTTCASQTEQRFCNNGNLSGSFPSSTCREVVGDGSCTTAWGAKVAHMDFVWMYLEPTPTGGRPCLSQRLYCLNNVMTGTSYKYTSCTGGAGSSSSGSSSGGTTTSTIVPKNKYERFAADMYMLALNRPPDLQGWTSTSQYLQNAPTVASCLQIFRMFYKSAEFMAITEGNSTLAVNYMYRGILNRSPESAAYTTWRTPIDSGKMTRAQVAEAIITAPEATTRCQAMLNAP